MLKILILLILPVIAQGSTSFDSIMVKMKPVDSQQVLDTHVRDPLYRDLQVQYRTTGGDQMELGGSSRVAVKVNLLAWGQRTNEKELNREYEKLSATIAREGNGGECYFRSLLWSEAFTSILRLRILERLNSYLSDEGKLLQRGIGENLYEFKELLRQREEEMKTRLEISELKSRLQIIENSLNERLEAPVEIATLDYSNFINVSSISERMLSAEPRRIELEKLHTLSKIHSLELEIEKREANQILDNIELYRWNESKNYGTSYGVQFTFNIPFLNKRTYMKDAVQRQVAINKYHEGQRDLLEKSSGTEVGFKNRIARYEDLISSDYFKVLKGMKKLLAGSRNNSPLMILQTKSKLAKEKLKRLELRHDITAEYLQKLLHEGQLTSCATASYLVRK